MSDKKGEYAKRNVTERNKRRRQERHAKRVQRKQRQQQRRIERAWSILTDEQRQEVAS